MLQYWNFNTGKRTFGRFGWTLLEGNSATQAGATAQHANSTLQHKRPSCASHTINTRDLTCWIEVRYSRFTIVKKTQHCLMFFTWKRPKPLAFALDMPDHQLGLSIGFTQSNTGVFARPYRVISVAALSVSNDYMLTWQGLIHCVRNEYANANLSRTK